MHTYHSFVPNYPPPPIPTRESIINEGLKTLEQSRLDQQWLKMWLERKKEQQQQQQSSLHRITLSDYRQKLIHHAQLLQQYAHALNHSNHHMLLEIQTKIEQSNTFLYDRPMIENIQKQIHRRKSKRTRLRRQKETKIVEVKSQIIEDKSFTDKIQDLKNILHTIEKLKQLQDTRQQQNDTSDQNQTMNELMELEKMCTAKLLEYQIGMKEKSPASHIDLYNYLFNNHDQSFYESMHSDAQYFLRAHQNVNDLVQIRQAWDQYATTHISSTENMILSQWHEPQLSCDSNWTAYVSARHASP